MLTLNTTVAPWDNKVMRHALSYAIDRQQIVNVVYEGAGGAGAISNFIFPTYKALQPYRDAASDILAPLSEFNLDKSHQLIESQGYKLLDGLTAYTVAHGRNGRLIHNTGNMGGGVARSSSSSKPAWSRTPATAGRRIGFPRMS